MWFQFAYYLNKFVFDLRFHKNCLLFEAIDAYTMIKDMFIPCWVTCLHGVRWYVSNVFDGMLTLCLIKCLHYV